MLYLLSPVTENPQAQVGICTVMVLVVLDVLVGFIGAIITKTVSSQKMRAGLLHKFSEIVVVILADVVDSALIGGFDIVDGTPVLLATCVYIAFMEISSILELAVKYNPQLKDLSIFSFVIKDDKQ